MKDKKIIQLMIISAVIGMAMSCIVLLTAHYRIVANYERDLATAYNMVSAVQDRIIEQDDYIKKLSHMTKFERLLWTMLGEEGKDNLTALEGCMRSMGLKPVKTVKLGP